MSIGTSRMVLVADDDENDFFLLNWAFSRVGTPVHLVRVEDGMAAIEYLNGTGEFTDRVRFQMPDLVLLDLKMPRRDGFEVLEWLRSQPGLRSVIAVVLSSSRHEGDIERAYRLGANSYLTKPNDSLGFTELARAFVEFWFRWSQVPRATVNELAVGQL